ncbi:MAG: NACHT domain-containing protein, partial [Planctomycetes bacterium]|nr:NACHT domain-containing protein [Planctomycetota bacterium]
MSFVLGWLGKFALSELEKRVLERLSSESFQDRLNQVAEAWAHGLPPEAELQNVEGFFGGDLHGLDSTRQPPEAVFEILDRGGIPTPEGWTELFVWYWESIREVQPDPVPFFTLDAAEARGHLQKLAERVAHECATDPSRSLPELIKRTQPPVHDLPAEKQDYLDSVAAACEWIDLGGLAPRVGTELLRLPIDDVFVHLHAERDMPLADELVQEEFRLKHELERDGVDANTIEEEIEKLAEQYGRRAKGEEARVKKRVEIPDALQHSRIVVLGDPGAGKTTLLRYVARQVASHGDEPPLPVGPGMLPVYVRLAEYDQYCQQGPASLTDYLPNAARVRGLDLSVELLEACAKGGKCLFLLDGLDEIAQPGRRTEIRDRVAELAARHPNCRMVVTSRIVGYREAQLPGGPGGYQHFTLLPFDDDEIRLFAERWYEAIEGTGKVADPERQNARALFEGIQDNPSVKRLATNPLLMTLIGLIYWREVRLPRRRIELYRDASQTLLSKWVQMRTPEVELNEREATSLLITAAFEMHSTSSSGLIARPELERLLVGQMTDPERGGKSAMEAETAVHEFLRIMNEQVGLFYIRGYDDRNEDVFGFLHLTFEEYFAGRELARRWLRRELKLRDYLHRPRWEEPIRLAAGHLSGLDDEQRANDFLAAILDAGSSYERECHRDLLLAARCLGDDAFAYPRVIDRVFDELDRALATSIVPLNDQITATVGTMRESRVAARASRLLLTKLDHDDRYVRSAATKALGRLGASAATPEAVSALVERLGNEAEDVRSAAAEALGSLGSSAA